MIVAQQSLQERIDFVADSSPYLSGPNILIQASAQRVTLRGVVTSYYEKQMAQETLLRIDGVRGVDNRLEVMRRREISPPSRVSHDWLTEVSSAGIP